jgi:DNA-directed RNA polymerase I subunit RPA1
VFAAECLLLQVHLLDPEKPGQPRRLQTEGINFPGVWQQQALLDVNAIACNDVHAMLTTYGVEAARATILREVQVRAAVLDDHE